jgi:hypothetical protein
MTRKSMTPVERPAAEPEILPPESPRSAWKAGDAADGGFFGARYGQRVYVAKVGPWSLAMLGALALLIGIAAVVFVVGALLFWIPIIAVLVLAGLLIGKLRWGRFGR